MVTSFFILSQTNTNASENSSYSSSNSRFVPEEEDNFSLLLTISKSGGSFAHTFFLLGFNAIEGKVRVLRLPEECILSKKDENRVILKECFEKGGQAAAAKAISQFFGIDLTRYISFTDQGFVSFIDNFEPTAVDITEDLSEVDRKSEIYIKIDRGRRLIGGALMLDIFAYTKWKGGPTASFYESAKTLCAFLSQNGAKLEGSRDLILTSAATNLSALDFENRRDAFFYLLSLPDAAESVGIYGEYQLQNTQFTLSDTSCTKISALF